MKMKRKLLLILVFVLLGILFFSSIFSLKNILIIGVPIILLIIELFFLVGISIYIYRKFKEKYRKEKLIFIEEWHETKTSGKRRL